MKTNLICLRAMTLAAVVAFATQATADGPLLFDATGSAPFDTTFANFDGNVTSSPEGFVIDVPAGADTFGGVVVTTGLLANPVLTSADSLIVRAMLGPNNESDFVVAIREASNEFFSIGIPASSFSATEFTDVKVEIGDFFFNGDVADGIPNESVIEVSVQSPFGGTGAVNLIVESVSAHIVPEPTTMGLALFGAMALVRRRRS